MSNRLSLRAALLLVALGSLAGCSDDDPAPAAPCNDLSNDGPPVTPALRSAGTTPAGGTIEDGRYAQTAFDYYPDPGATIPTDPRTLSSVFEFIAGSFEAVVKASLGDEEQSDRFSGTYAASGTELTLTYSCPDAGTVEHPSFTATPDELRLFYRIASNTATAEIVLSKQ